LRLIDSCSTQLKAQGPSRTCNESKEELKKKMSSPCPGFTSRRIVDAHCGSEEGSYLRLIDFVHHSTLCLRVKKEEEEEDSVQLRCNTLHFALSCASNHTVDFESFVAPKS